MKLEDVNKLHADGKLGGFFTTLSSDDYHAAPGISKSGLDQVHKSPATYQEWKKNPQNETPSLRKGKMYHHCILEPDTFSKVWRAKPDRQKRSDADKEWWKEFEKELAANGQSIAPVDEIESAFRMQEALLKQKIIRQALTGLKEVSAFVNEVETGVLVKARADVINPVGAIIDLKTTDDCGEDAFARSIVNYRYHVQNAFHADVINQAIAKYGPIEVMGRKVEKVKNPILIAVEKEPPFNFEIYTMHLDDLSEGFNAYKEDLHLFAKCLKTNEWPTTGGTIKEIRLPKWAKRTQVTNEV